MNTNETRKREVPDRLKNLVEYFIADGKTLEETVELSLKIYDPSLYYPTRKKIISQYCESRHPNKKDAVFRIEDIAVEKPKAERKRKSTAKFEIKTTYVPKYGR